MAGWEKINESKTIETIEIFFNSNQINEVKTIEKLTIGYGWLRLVVAWERSSKERAKILAWLIENKNG